MQNLPAEYEVTATDYGYMNEETFFEWLQNFQKHCFPEKRLPMFDGHASNSSLKCSDYCRENDI
jgi:hypothetical protein